jgi:nitroreductase
MNLEECLNARRSIRAFTSTPVPDETLRTVFSLAQKAASNCNTQPWKSYVVSGQKCDQLRQALFNTASANTAPNPDFCTIPTFHDQYKTRQFECAMAMYGTMGITRENKAGRWDAMLRNYEFFDAPHVVFIVMPKAFNINCAVDVGAYLQTLMLAMTAHGLSSCAQGALAQYPDVVREYVDIPAEEGILVGVSFGYEKADVPVNNTVTSRAAVDEVVRFCQ